jgi:hypothetical protein
MAIVRPLLDEALVSEIVNTDVDQTLAAMCSLALFAALGAAAAFVLVTTGVFRDTTAGRWGSGSAWMISTCGATLVAAPLSLWGIPIAAAISLPALWITIYKTRIGRLALLISDKDAASSVAVKSDHRNRSRFRFSQFRA